MKYLLFIVVQFCTFFNPVICQEDTNSDLNAIFLKTDAYLETMRDSLEIVGLNYAILVDNEIVHQNQFGLANLQLQVPMQADHLFPVASISKMFSSTALHQVLNAQNRSVNETVADFLPNRLDLPESWRQLTLKQLLSHTSGIPDQIDYQIYLAPENEQMVIDALKDKPFTSKPGAASKYNATGYLLIRIIIEELVGQDFESYMQKQFFDRFELQSAVYGGYKKIVPNRVTCYQNVNGEKEMYTLNYSPPMYAGAGLNIKMADLLKWFQLVQKGEVLSLEHLEAIWTPVKLTNGEDGFFGLGWEAYQLSDEYRMVGHGGAGISSFRHYWNSKTKKSVTVVLLTNGAFKWGIRPNQMNAHIASMLLEE